LKVPIVFIRFPQKKDSFDADVLISVILSGISGTEEGTNKKAALKCVSCESQYPDYAPVWQDEIISAA